MTPLLRAMKIFGLYFVLDDCVSVKDVREPANSPETINATDDTGAETEELSKEKTNYFGTKFNRFYSIAVLILLWANLLRLFTFFNSNTSFDNILLSKLVNLSWMLLSAIDQTSLFIACQSGRLHRILREIRVTREDTHLLRKNVIIQTLLIASVYVLYCAYYLYFIFNTTGEMVDFLVAPFLTLVPVSSGIILLVLHIIVAFIASFLLSAWLLPLTLINVITIVISKQFAMLDRRFTEAIDESGSFTGDLRLFRRRHPSICHAVRRADRFVGVSNLAGFGCHMISFVIVLFSEVTFPFSPSTQTMTGIANFFWLFFNTVGLIRATSNGFSVNTRVSDVHNVRFINRKFDCEYSFVDSMNLNILLTF